MALTLVLLLTCQPGNAATFAEYLSDVREKALAEGISATTVDSAFSGLIVDERVIGFDRRQPEFVQTFEEYLTARVTEFRKNEARRLFREHRMLLKEIGEKFGVDPQYIVAFWGLETSFGRYQGKYSIIRSLATLGHDERRSEFFTAELLNALKILDEGHVAPEDFVGAWAGAMGQGQFMPSSFLRYAQDYDGDGRKDIWASLPDVFASIAFYLHESGWRAGAGWGTAVVLPAGFEPQTLVPDEYDTTCRALRNHTKPMDTDLWRDKGLTWSDSLPGSGEWALVLPEPGAHKSYLVGGNYRSILRYNCANKYAVSVGLLADWIVSPEST